MNTETYPQHALGSVKTLEGITSTCARCDEPVFTEMAIEALASATVCPRCKHAYYCFLFLREFKKCISQKREKEKTVADYACQECSRAFTRKYNMEWRQYLARVFPQFETELTHGWREPVEVYALRQSAIEKGFIETMEETQNVF